jgi:magnesium-protoporphyrin IX monomethyl ester (oxidative) cyclase
MSYFRHVCLLNAPQAFPFPHPYTTSSLTELCYLAAAIKPQVETVSIPVDFLGERAFDDFSRFLKSRPVDLVGISCMTGAFSNALRIARLAKRHDIFAVLGGYHPSALPEETLRCSEVDAVVIGEGELTLRELVRSGPSEEIDGLAYKDDGKIIVNKPRALIEDLDSLPQPLRKARPARLGEAGDDYSTDTIYTSRGCPWRCAFCANALVHKKWRARSPENVIEELSSLHDSQRRKLIKIWDANFMTDMARVERICDLMVENRLLNFRIWTEARVDDIIRAEPIMGKLSRVGLSIVNLGIESPKAESLKFMKKETSPDRIRLAVDILRKHRITQKGYFIIGSLNETPEDVKKYPECAESLGLREAVFMVMTPYPGTAVFEEYRQRDRIRTYNWDLYNNFTPVVETEAMDEKTLKRMYAYCWGRFYAGIYYLDHYRRTVLLPVIAKIFEILVAFTHILRSDPSNTEDDVRQYQYEFLKAQTDRVISVSCLRRPSAILRLLKYFAVRFQKSPTENIVFNMTSAGRKVIIIAQEEKKLTAVRGPTIRLKDVARLAGLLSREDIAVLYAQISTWKLNRKSKLGTYGRLLKDKKIRRAVFALAKYAVSLILNGAAAAGIHALGRKVRRSR